VIQIQHGRTNQEYQRPCLTVSIQKLEIPKDVFNRKLLQQRDETTELSLKLKTAIDSGNKVIILSRKEPR